MMTTSWTKNKHSPHKIQQIKYDTNKRKKVDPWIIHEDKFIKNGKANLFPRLNEEATNWHFHLHLFAIP
jgi:hypothetical protein